MRKVIWDSYKRLLKVDDEEYTLWGPPILDPMVFEYIHHEESLTQEGIQYYIYASMYHRIEELQTALNSVHTNNVALSSKYNMVTTVGSVQTAMGFDTLEEVIAWQGHINGQG